jgi:hypothetical protein
LIILEDVSMTLALGDVSGPRPPQPNDIPGTVNGCANAILVSDEDGNGIVTGDEYLDLANTIAGLLCLPPIVEETLEIQTVFISSICLCEEIESFGSGCCFGENAGIFVGGAADPTSRTEDQDTYLRSVCLFAQSVFGPSQCDEEFLWMDGLSEDEVTVEVPVDALASDKMADDIPGTVTGCTGALLATDHNNDGVIGREEYLDFVNIVAELMCMPLRPTFDLRLQTSFVSLACLCMDGTISMYFESHNGVYVSIVAFRCSGVGDLQNFRDIQSSASCKTKPVSGQSTYQSNNPLPL